MAYLYALFWTDPYFALYPDDEARAKRHYECNLMLAESLYVSLSVLEVIGWMNRNLPEWVEAQERFTAVCAEIRRKMEWE